jgi:hypothetical protein
VGAQGERQRDQERDDNLPRPEVDPQETTTEQFGPATGDPRAGAVADVRNSADPTY